MNITIAPHGTTTSPPVNRRGSSTASRRIGEDVGVAVLCCRPTGVDVIGDDMVRERRHEEAAPAEENGHKVLPGQHQHTRQPE
jgi:hypothetical protein